MVRIRFRAFFVIGARIMFPVLPERHRGPDRRIREAAPALSYTQTASRGLRGMAIGRPARHLLRHAYRPERAPEMTHLLNDISWIVFMVAFVPFCPGPSPSA